MSLSGQDLTESIPEGGSHVFRLTGFLGDIQRLHDSSRPVARAFRDYRIWNITGTPFLAATLLATKSSDWPPAAHAMAHPRVHGGVDKPGRRELRRSALAVDRQFRQ